MTSPGILLLALDAWRRRRMSWGVVGKRWCLAIREARPTIRSARLRESRGLRFQARDTILLAASYRTLAAVVIDPTRQCPEAGGIAPESCILAALRRVAVIERGQRTCVSRRPVCRLDSQHRP